MTARWRYYHTKRRQNQVPGEALLGLLVVRTALAIANRPLFFYNADGKGRDCQ